MLEYFWIILVFKGRLWVWGGSSKGLKISWTVYLSSKFVFLFDDLSLDWVKIEYYLCLSLIFLKKSPEVVNRELFLLSENNQLCLVIYSVELAPSLSSSSFCKSFVKGKLL